ncbi:MAG: sigma-70 family RNA polymerase sigma factor [Planctomycetes bacterium]|nr:sigma-70 family RNA polymerase sigma factor [Planctomycetota bacterium]
MRSDADVVADVLGGRRDAFAELVDRYRGTACAVATAVLGDRHRGEDAAQEAFLLAYEQLAALRDPAAFSSWLLTIVHRQALRMASRSREVASPEAAARSVATQSNGQLDDAAAALLDRVADLPEHERLVVTLHHFDGHSVRAIAEMTGSPPGTITKQLSRAYQRLRDQMKEFRP